MQRFIQQHRCCLSCIGSKPVKSWVCEIQAVRKKKRYFGDIDITCYCAYDPLESFKVRHVDAGATWVEEAPCDDDTRFECVGVKSCFKSRWNLQDPLWEKPWGVARDFSRLSNSSDWLTRSESSNSSILSGSLTLCCCGESPPPLRMMSLKRGACKWKRRRFGAGRYL